MAASPTRFLNSVKVRECNFCGWNPEATVVISSWGTDKTFRSCPRLMMNAIADNCFVNGTSGEIGEI